MKEPTFAYRAPRHMVEWLKAHNMRDGCNCLRCRVLRVLLSLHGLVFDRERPVSDALRLMAFVVAVGVAMALAFAGAMLVIYFLFPWGT